MASTRKRKTAGIDQAYPLSIGNDGLVYHTDPLPNETPLVGCPKVTLWVSLDTPDTDLSVDLYEIQPDGTSIALWSDLRRLRYRESLRQEKLVKPGEIVRCDFNPGLFVARRLMKGSRLRLVVFSELNLRGKRIIARAESSPTKPRKTRAPRTSRFITTRRTPARFNCRCADSERDEEGAWFFRCLILLATLTPSKAAEKLDKLADDFWTWRAKYAPFTGDDVNRIERPGGMRDWSRAKIDNHRKELAEFEARWKKIDINGWPIPKQVDYRLIGSALSRVRWELDINPRWKRDPNFYIEQTLTPSSKR